MVQFTLLKSFPKRNAELKETVFRGTLEKPIKLGAEGARPKDRNSQAKGQRYCYSIVMIFFVFSTLELLILSVAFFILFQGGFPNAGKITEFRCKSQRIPR